MRILSTAAGTARHGIGAVVEAAVVVAIGAALVFGAAVITRSDPAGAADVYAAKGGNGNGHGGGGNAGSGSTSAVIVVPDGVFGGTTTATANPGGPGAWVHVRCYQGGGVALEAYVTVDGANQATFQLGPTPSWPNGAASCEAEEGYWDNSRWQVLASTTFNVSP